MLPPGGSQTEELRKSYPYPNIIIEDFIRFDDVMPYADLYITNGGYGGVLLSIQNQLPMVVAGIHEGKNEINARVGYFKLGINLKTERPSVLQLRKAAEEILSNDLCAKNVKQPSKEFKEYDPNDIYAPHAARLIRLSAKTKSIRIKEQALIY